MWKRVGISRKALIILIALLLVFSFGSGFNRAFADQDIQSRLSSWFDNRKNESISEMDQAITLEKNRLMDQLRLELQLEMQRAQAQLARHTVAEIAQSIQLLEQYAAELSSGIHVSNETDKDAVSSNIDKALEDAKALIQESAVVPNVPAVTIPVTKPEIEETIDESEVQQPVQESTPTPETLPTPGLIPEDKPSGSIPDVSESIESVEN